MLIADLFEETYLAIFSNKSRSGLTILGIVIGIGSVIAMISIGQGATGSIETSIQSMGSNLITVMPGFQRNFSQVASNRGSAQTLTIEDSKAIAKEVSFVQAVAPEVSRRYQVVAKGKNTNTQVVGTVAEYLSVKNAEIDSGSFITEQNILNQSKVAALGPTTRDDLFGEGANPIGQTIRINGINFKVIGVTKSKGGTGFGSQDDMVFIPITTAQKFLTGTDYVSTISIQAKNPQVMADVQTGVTNLLLSLHNISDPQLADFSTLSQQDILGAASSITNTMTILLAAIAGISLIVGGIGIMNMMMTTVTERTREIGLRKAIGAKRADISLQFLTEAVMLTFIGGAFGIILGSVLAYGITVFGGMATKISLFSIILAFSVSAAIGIIFGYWPAQKAAKLNPIEALRYE
ncbi:MAG: multidrug ABC transporter substrate-binding protein [Candidatus Nealsonbacteria bacterium CG_4_10_14_0_2_um_filter_38_17]|uniref:Multidrug ABC transporter substrate-binding protein n=2 Tax=Candidatus Nealsoniibacteriota TaxID=1817911 RepID=A0A2M7UX51_9BACT|nr:MAG: multidrug ABC transporter substrate-binding protein [Candidatus Nealsonbacteria bacterium CG23_combo_of_CG06-09_8_20_14_all_38_19]PIZ88546.1 MAG: multidrug ABC transporter substrate-binding protein [Candidatus Nealsonbacteria bacterium CG_4_10_14_0_2_um_filter_38_17]